MANPVRRDYSLSSHISALPRHQHDIQTEQIRVQREKKRCTNILSAGISNANVPISQNLLS